MTNTRLNKIVQHTFLRLKRVTMAIDFAFFVVQFSTGKLINCYEPERETVLNSMTNLAKSKSIF